MRIPRTGMGSPGMRLLGAGVSGSGGGGIAVPGAGMVKSDGAALLVATPGVDYVYPPGVTGGQTIHGGAASGHLILKANPRTSGLGQGNHTSFNIKTANDNGDLGTYLANTQNGGQQVGFLISATHTSMGMTAIGDSSQHAMQFVWGGAVAGTYGEHSGSSTGVNWTFGPRNTTPQHSSTRYSLDSRIQVLGNASLAQAYFLPYSNGDIAGTIPARVGTDLNAAYLYSNFNPGTGNADDITKASLGVYFDATNDLIHFRRSAPASTNPRTLTNVWSITAGAPPASGVTAPSAGMVKSNGTVLQAAVANTDYATPASTIRGPAELGQDLLGAGSGGSGTYYLSRIVSTIPPTTDNGSPPSSNPQILPLILNMRLRLKVIRLGTVTTGGNIRIGVYSTAGTYPNINVTPAAATKVYDSGSILNNTMNALVTPTINVELDPGLYWVLVAFDSTAQSASYVRSKAVDMTPLSYAGLYTSVIAWLSNDTWDGTSALVSTLSTPSALTHTRSAAPLTIAVQVDLDQPRRA